MGKGNVGVLKLYGSAVPFDSAIVHAEFPTTVDGGAIGSCKAAVVGICRLERGMLEDPLVRGCMWFGSTVNQCPHSAWGCWGGGLQERRLQPFSQFMYLTLG